MNWILNSVKNVIKSLAVIIFITLVISCGGGEGGNASEEVTPITVTANIVTDIAPLDQPRNDYTPDTEKLAITAQSSADLYVESSFNFTSYQNVTFTINVTDNEGNPMANKLLSISSIDSEIVEYDDPRLQEKSLLVMAKTDDDGKVYLTLEIPQYVSNVLLELNAVGLENEVILSLDTNGIVDYQFQPTL
ncbi:MAG: hypothetical protein QNK36_10440 [Colwellia sp.]|nr:hypothetical protein [Colwellia sp.]